MYTILWQKIAKAFDILRKMVTIKSQIAILWFFFLVYICVRCLIMSLKLIEQRYFEEIKSTGRYYQHSSGAKFIHMANEDENKVFSVTFKTPVWDNTGVAHILEHSILCGSKKYPIKDPFNELAKSSLYTYLNAMTFTDKTMYPIASCNHKDFYNLMNVYLDAVFNPLIRRKEIFMQEGIHYNPKTQSFGGIVYNEMQGVYSDPLEFLRHETAKHLFPHTQNAFDAGGKPDSIEDLTFDQLIDFHSKYYKPSNAYFFLYGNMDFEDCLKQIEPYLESSGIKEEVALKYQKPFDKPQFFQGVYESEQSGQSLLGASFVIENSQDSKTIMGLLLINQYLFGTNASPLKQLLIEQDFGKEIFSYLNLHLCQPVYHITVKYAKKTAQDLQTTLTGFFTNLLKEGFEETQLTAALNILEFDLREDKSSSFPKGLTINIGLMTNWLYGHDPFEKVNRLEPLLEIGENKEFLYNIIENIFIKNNHILFASMTDTTPKPIVPKAFTQEQLNNYQQELQFLDLFQNKQDKKEDIDKIPVLNISEIDKTLEAMPIVETKSGITCYSYYQDTMGIGYVQLLFDVCGIEWEDIPYIGVLCNILGRLDTKNYSQKALLTEINTYLGGLRPQFTTFTNVVTGELTPYLVYKAKSLMENHDKIFALIDEITHNTIFDNPTQLMLLLNEQFSAMESALRNNGMGFASGRCLAYINNGVRFEDAVYGVEYYYFLKNILASSNMEALIQKLKQICTKIFSSAVKIYTSANETECAELHKKAAYYYSAKNADEKFCAPKTILSNEGIVSGANVQNVAYGFDFGKLVYSINGQTSVITTILNRAYLMTEVRLRGGAYGCNCVAYKKGLFNVCSYRDPHLTRTLDVYKGISNFLRNLTIEDEEMNKYLIGTINRYLRPKKALERVELAIASYLNGITHQMMEKECQDILAMKPTEILKFADFFEECHKYHVYTVVGGKEQITNNRDIFKSILF